MWNTGDILAHYDEYELAMSISRWFDLDRLSLPPSDPGVKGAKEQDM